MAERPPPEAIRGSWYYLPISVNPLDLGDKPPQAMRFRLDGTFTRYIVKDGSWSDKENGDYTFDGQFLIVRGRNTDTFRVTTDSFWRWSLEGKREEQLLLRGLADRSVFGELSAEDAKEIRILPIRVAVRSGGDSDSAIHDLVYRADGREIRVGAFFVEHDRAARKVWVGVAPFVAGIEGKTWERIVRESYLDIFCGKPADVQVATVRLLDSNESRVFNYAVS